MVSSEDMALLAAEAADAKKGFDISILDLRGLTTIADYFVICSSGNATQSAAIADSIDEAFSRSGSAVRHIEGGEEARWILMDCGDVVVHIFDEHTRHYYSLEKLWGDAPQVPYAVKPAGAAAVSR